MTASKSLRSVLLRSSAAMQESARARDRAQRSISTSEVIIDRSRQLLSAWPFSGTPALSLQRFWENVPLSPIAPQNIKPEPPASRTLESGASLERLEGRTFNGSTLRLDGRHFVDCTIEDCVLEYSGGPVILEGTHFAGCRYSFSGEAAMTISLLECFGLFEGQVQPTTLRSASPGSARVN